MPDSASVAESPRPARSTALEAVPRRPVVVLGVGNTLLSDDGVGVRAIQRLSQEDIDGPIEWVDGGTLNFALLGYLEGARALIVIDAAELKAPPGTVRTYFGEEMDDMVGRGRRNSVHEAGLADLLAMARLKDCLPAHRMLITVQPQRIDWGDGLSPPVADALDGICERVRLLALRWAE